MMQKVCLNLEVPEPVMIHASVVWQDVRAGKSSDVVIWQIKPILVELTFNELLEGCWPHSQIPQGDLVAWKKRIDLWGSERNQVELKISASRDRDVIVGRVAMTPSMSSLMLAITVVVVVVTVIILIGISPIMEIRV